MAAAIQFFTEDVQFKLNTPRKVSSWIKATIESEGKTLNAINFIFCSDEYLAQINIEYLNHDTYTDIITFDNSEEENHIEGDIFISIDRIRENASTFNKSETDELHRVIIHGVLHLIGYLDKKPSDKKLMTQKEDEYLSKR
jgi:probable rRNA maturation factor